MKLALGTPVLFTECAGVARKGSADMWNKGWHLPQKSNGVAGGYQIEEKDGAWFFDLTSFRTIGDPTPVRFVNQGGEVFSPPETTSLNKAVVVWESEGSGVVCGLETKQYGTSHPSGGGTNLYGEGEWEPGYFESHGQIKLYVVRSQLEGRDFVYVPTWAIRPLFKENS